MAAARLPLGSTYRRAKHKLTYFPLSRFSPYTRLRTRLRVAANSGVYFVGGVVSLKLTGWLLLGALTGQFAEEAVTSVASVYTPLTGAQCRVVNRQQETGATVSKCPGPAGYSLLVLEDDSRTSITVVSPAQKKHPLDYWGVVTRAFSSLGPRAEWRVARRGGKPEPLALIVRVEHTDQQDPDKPVKKSTLAVAKITVGQICVTDKIPGGQNANAQARDAAASSRSKACLAPLK